MDHQWRPTQPQSTICPFCSFSHFPFCPPPQHHPPYNHFPPPQPDYPRPAFDPYPPPHHTYMPDPRPMHINPNFDRQYPTNPIYDYNNNNSNGYVISEVDRSYKRPRVDELPSNSGRFLSDDERRLKLIRDHGGASCGPTMPLPPPPPPPPRNVEPQGLMHYDNNQKIRPNEDYWQEFSGSNQYGMQQEQANYMSQNNGNLGQNYPNPNMNERRGYLPPLPASPPPPLPVDLPPMIHSSPPPKTCNSLFPVHVSSSPMVPSFYPPILSHASTGFISEESQAIHRTAVQYVAGEGQSFPLKQFSPEKPKVIDASHLFKQPHRATRPDHLVIILRGLPGSGKSYLAKMLRDLEVENGGDAPRIHSMDDYFMTEVEKVEESDVSKSSSSVRSKKSVVKKVMEYCYEPEMEEAYRSSMLKAFKRTLEEGIFTFIIVDDRNLRVADFAQFWAIAKRLGYEVYILEATYKDPAGCAARNVHGFTLDEIRNMAGQWEEAPSLYLQLDIKSLFHGDDLKESGIQEVVMDMGDGDIDEGLCGLQEGKPAKIIVPSVGDDAPDDLDPSKDGKRWDGEGAHPTEEVKELGRSKWSDDLDEDDTEKSEGVRGNINALSGLIQAYSKEGKSVRWGDKVGNTGFSIGAAKKATVLSLVIGPGAGYNLKSNPLPEKESPSTSSTSKSKKQRMFQEQLRAERESFKAVFDRRKQRIGLDLEEE